MLRVERLLRAQALEHLLALPDLLRERLLGLEDRRKYLLLDAGDDRGRCALQRKGVNPVEHPREADKGAFEPPLYCLATDACPERDVRAALRRHPRLEELGMAQPLVLRDLALQRPILLGADSSPFFRASLALPIRDNDFGGREVDRFFYGRHLGWSLGYLFYYHLLRRDDVALLLPLRTLGRWRHVGKPPARIVSHTPSRQSAKSPAPRGDFRILRHILKLGCKSASINPQWSTTLR